VKAVATILRVSRFLLHEQLQGGGRLRHRYAKADDGEFLPLVRSPVDKRQAKGHQRIEALLSRQRSTQSL